MDEMVGVTVRAHRRRTQRNLSAFVRTHVRSRRFGILSASKSSLSDRENASRTDDLLVRLSLSGYDPLEAEGIYTHLEGPEAGKRVTERSVFVPDLRSRQALEFGKMYEQESVLVGARLLRSRDGKTLQYVVPERAVFGRRALKAEYATVVKGKRGSVAFTIPPRKTGN